MPPQQAYGLLDFVDNTFNFCTHEFVLYQTVLLFAD